MTELQTSMEYEGYVSIQIKMSEFAAFLGSFLSEVHDIDLVRIWLFEGMEGLIFDDNNELVSIERTFLESLKKILDLAAQSNIRVYLCLFDAWVAKHRPATLDAMGLIIHGPKFINNILTN